MFANILHPDRYHGSRAKPPFFEGWYYKLVSKDEKTRYALIPGVYLSPDPDQSHCFIQVFDSEAKQVRYHRYPYKAFKSMSNAFKISVGPNHFSADEIVLAIEDDLGRLEGSLHFSALNPWPVRMTSPGAMGWFAWAPFMECYHGVVSMDHIIQGELLIDGQTADFSGGRGYIEKDWGKQFPSAWIWGQSNHFSQPGISLMLSVAVVPLLGRSFGGYIIGLLYEGVIHRFATYNLSRIEELTIHDTEIHLVVKNATHRLSVQAERVEGKLLQAPTAIAMDRRIIETMNASLEICFQRLDGQTLFQGVGQHAGLETVGNLDHLIALFQ